METPKLMWDIPPDLPSQDMNPVTAFMMLHLKCDNLLPLLALPRLFERELSRTTAQEIRDEVCETFRRFLAHPHALRDLKEVSDECHGCYALTLDKQQRHKDLLDLVEAWNPEEPLPQAIRDLARRLLMEGGANEPYEGWDNARGWDRDDPRDPLFKEVRGAAAEFTEWAYRLAGPKCLARWRLSWPEIRRGLEEALRRLIPAVHKIQGMNLGDATMVQEQHSAPVTWKFLPLLERWPPDEAPPVALWAEMIELARDYLDAIGLRREDHDWDAFEGWDRLKPP